MMQQDMPYVTKNEYYKLKITPLMRLANSGKKHAIKYILDNLSKKLSPNTINLNYDIKSNDYKLNWLLFGIIHDYIKFDVNDLDIMGYSAINYAIMNGDSNLEVVKLLIDYGAIIREFDIHIALIYEAPLIASLLKFIINNKFKSKL
jgi:ankyrin repeat protein